MEKSAADSQYINNQLIEGLSREKEKYRAELEAVRDQIDALLSGPYLPNPRAIIKALYPNDETVKQYYQEENLMVMDHGAQEKHDKAVRDALKAKKVEKVKYPEKKVEKPGETK